MRVTLSLVCLLAACAAGWYGVIMTDTAATNASLVLAMAAVAALWGEPKC